MIACDVAYEGLSFVGYNRPACNRGIFAACNGNVDCNGTAVKTAHAFRLQNVGSVGGFNHAQNFAVGGVGGVFAVQRNFLIQGEIGVNFSHGTVELFLFRNVQKVVAQSQQQTAHKADYHQNGNSLDSLQSRSLFVVVDFLYDICFFSHFTSPPFLLFEVLHSQRACEE